MKIIKKTDFKKMLEFFNKTLKTDNWAETSKIWQKTLADNGWTEDEFDNEFLKAVYNKGGINEEKVH